MIIPGFSNYDIDTNGVVTNISTGVVVKPYVSYENRNNKYLRVSIKDDSGLIRGQNVLRLLALTYLEKPEGCAVARAVDGNNLNAVLSNAEWVARKSVSRQVWSDGKCVQRKPRKNNCCTEASVSMLYEVLQQYDAPVTMGKLSIVLEVPYAVIRYSMYQLIKDGKARKTKQGYEVIR